MPVSQTFEKQVAVLRLPPGRRPQPGTVASAFCHGDTVEPFWRASYQRILFDDSRTERRIVAEFDQASSGAHIPSTRCRMVQRFLDHPARPDWLWIHDTDAVFEPDTLERLLIAADPVERPIVGALAFSVTPDPVRQVALLPTLYLFDDQGVFRLNTYPVGDLVQVDATGCHCLLIHRSVLEHPIWDRSHPLPWFRMDVRNGEEVSEDIWFCRKAGEAGFPIWVDCSARTGHVKKFIADERWYLAQQHGGNVRTRRTVLVPSRDPQRVRGIVEQLVAQGDSWDEIIVAWNGTDLGTAAWLAGQPVTVVKADPADGIHAWWNLGLERGGDVALLNDDVVIGPGFLAALFAALAEPGVAIASGNYDGRKGGPFVDVDQICAGRYDGTGGMAGFAFALSGDWLAETGYRFPADMKWWFGDNDVLASALQSGWRCVIATDAHLLHDEHGGTDWASPEYATQLAADRAAFMAKWAVRA